MWMMTNEKMFQPRGSFGCSRWSFKALSLENLFRNEKLSEQFVDIMFYQGIEILSSIPVVTLSPSS